MPVGWKHKLISQQKESVCPGFTHSLLYLYSPVRIQLQICAFGHLNSSSGVRYFHARRSKPYTLSAETLYLFVENPRGFCWKPYTLLLGRSAPDSGRQDVGRLSVGRIRGEYARSSSRLLLYPYSPLCRRRIVGGYV